MINLQQLFRGRLLKSISLLLFAFLFIAGFITACGAGGGDSSGATSAKTGTVVVRISGSGV